MKKKLLNILSIVGLFILLSAFYYQPLSSLCNKTTKIDFDSQNFLTWNFAAQNGDVPYKDFFHPYGFLSLFRESSNFFFFLYSLLTPFLLIILFFWLKIILKRYYLSIPAFLIVLLTISEFTGQIFFNRYSTSVLIGLFFSYFFVKNKFSKYSLLLGVINGIILSLMTDQGITLSILAFIMIVTDLLLRIKKNLNIKKLCTRYIKIGLIYSLGFLLGLLPMFIYLNNHQALFDYFKSVIELSGMGGYAKIPFLPHLRFKENIFILVSIVAGLTSLLHKLLKNNKNKTLIYSYISVLVPLVFFELKNILRPISLGLIYIALLLVFIIISELLDYLRNKKITKIQIGLFFYFSLLIFTYSFNLQVYTLKFFNNYYQQLLSLPDEITDNLKNYECNSNLTNINESFLNVIRYIKNKDSYSSSTEVFPFPTDPIFYTLFNQKTSPFLNAYDGSPLFAQKRTIKYIKENNIDFIIYNMNDLAMDGVPYYLRASRLHSYLLSNFQPIEKIDNFLILEKIDNETGNFFKNNLLPSGFQETLLNTNLGYIPTSEGGKISKIEINVIRDSSSINELNRYLENNTVNSEDIILVFEPSSGTFLKNVLLSIQNDIQPLVSMQDCYEVCAINLSHLPSFYNSPQIHQIKTNPEFKGRIKLITSPSKKTW